jgi:glutathione S-transferase
MTATLYGHALSGNTHKVRLLLAFLKIPYQERPVDVVSGEHKLPDFLRVNPLGQVPAFVDEVGPTLHDSQAILIYLAAKHGSGRWWPNDPIGQGKVAQWLSFAANEIHNGAALARMHHLLGVPCDLGAVQEAATRSLDVLEDHFRGREWLELDRPTVADCAVFPYIALAPEGGVSLEGRPGLAGWLDRVRSLPDFVTMQGM